MTIFPMWLRRHGIGSSNGCGTPWSSSSKNQSALKVIHQLEEVLKSMPSGAMAAEVEKEVTNLREHQDRMDYVHVFALQAGDVALTRAQMPAQLIHRLAFGIHFGANDFLVFFKGDGPLVLEPNFRPLVFYDDRPRQPA